MVRGWGRTGDLSGGWGTDCYGDWARQGWAGPGLGRQGGLTWAVVGSSSLQLSGPGPFSLAAPAAGASSAPALAPALLLFMAWMGRGGGAAAPAPPPPRTDQLGGRRGEGRATAWEGATELGEEGGQGVWLRSRTPTDTVTHIFPCMPHPHAASERCTHCGGACAHTHSHQEMMETHIPMTHRLAHVLTCTGAAHKPTMTPQIHMTVPALQIHIGKHGQSLNTLHIMLVKDIRRHV